MTYENWEFQKCSKIEKMTGIGRKHSHAFVDLTDDGFADLVVTTEKSFDVWQVLITLLFVYAFAPQNTDISSHLLLLFKQCAQ